MSTRCQTPITHVVPLVTVRDGLSFGLGFLIAVGTGVVLSVIAAVVLATLAGRLAILLTI